MAGEPPVAGDAVAVPLDDDAGSVDSIESVDLNTFVSLCDGTGRTFDANGAVVHAHARAGAKGSELKPAAADADVDAAVVRRCCLVPSMVAMALFGTMSLFGQVGVTIALPVWVDSIMVGPGSDPYFVLFFASGAFSVLFAMWLVLMHLFSDQLTTQNTNLKHKDMFLVGFFNSLNGLMAVYSSPTERTAAFLQALLTNFSIPMTIGVRWLVLGRKINQRQGFAALLVIAGIFLALAPIVFGIDQKPVHGHNSAKGIARILWPLCFMLGFLPYALYTVYQEKGLKTNTSAPSKSARSRSRSVSSTLPGVFAPPSQSESANEYSQLLGTDGNAGLDKLYHSGGSHASHPSSGRRSSDGVASGVTHGSGSVNSPPKEDAHTHVHIVYFLAWTSIYQFVSVCLMFFTDLIPGFGMAGSAHALYERMSFGFRCVAGTAEECGGGGPAIKAVIFILFYSAGALGTGLLSRHPEGATLVALVQTLNTPVAGLFWTLFQASPFEWHPEWLATSYFSVGGLFLMIPGLVLYNMYSKAPGH